MWRTFSLRSPQRRSDQSLGKQTPRVGSRRKFSTTRLFVEPLQERRMLSADLVSDIYLSGDSAPSALTNVNGIVFFAATDGSNGRELWKSDGTGLGTVLVKNINLLGDSSPQNLVNVNGTLYFTADDGVNGRELW